MIHVQLKLNRSLEIYFSKLKTETRWEEISVWSRVSLCGRRGRDFWRHSSGSISRCESVFLPWGIRRDFCFWRCLWLSLIMCDEFLSFLSHLVFRKHHGVKRESLQPELDFSSFTTRQIIPFVSLAKLELDIVPTWHLKINTIPKQNPKQRWTRKDSSISTTSSSAPLAKLQMRLV